jgi:hypothetical protein
LFFIISTLLLLIQGLTFHEDAVERDDIGTEAEKTKLAKQERVTKQLKERGVDNIQLLRKLLKLSSDYKVMNEHGDFTGICAKLGLFKWIHPDGHCVWIGGDDEARQLAKKQNYIPPGISAVMPKDGWGGNVKSKRFTCCGYFDS